MKLFLIFSIIVPVLFISFLLLKTPAMAAAPDGLGPWADNVVSSSQGMMKNGSPVPAPRSDPNSALGVAENDTVDGNFFSLGFGGNIVLGFDNGISSGVFVVEATNNAPAYPDEKAKIEVSEDGITWVLAGNVTQDGNVEVPEQVSCAKFVRLTDISDPAIMPDDIADAYDVDGVEAQGESCTPRTSPTPTATASATPTPSNTPTPSSTPGPTDTPSTTTTTTTTTTAAGNPVPGFPNTGNLIPGLPDTGIGPDEKNTSWIQSSIDLIFSIIHKALNFTSN